MEKITGQDGVATREFKTLRNRIRELEQELGLLKISLNHKTTLLNSCEIALEREQFPQK